MRIRSLSLTNFKKFRSLDLELAEGLNVIKGPNESGKSTLMQSILAVLYWRPNSSRKEVRMCTSWGREDGFQLGMVADSERGEWTLLKDFSKRTALLEHEDEQLTDIDRIEEWVGEETGLPGEAVFRATAGIRQDDVENIVAGKDDLERSLQASVTGGGEGISARGVVVAMQKARADLTRGMDRPVKNAGALAAAQTRRQSLEEEHRQLEEEVESLRQARLREKELQEELAGQEEELAAALRLQENFQEQTDLETELEDLRQRFAEADQTVSLWIRREEMVNERVERYSKLEEALTEKRDWLDRAEVRHKGLDESIERMEAECAKLEQSPDREIPRWPVLLAGGIVLIVGGGIGALYVKWLALLVVVGVVLVTLGVQQTRVKRTGGKALALASMNQQLKEMQLDRSDLERSVKKVISEVGAASMDNFEEIKQKYFKLLEDLRDVENKLEVLSQGKSCQDLEKEMDEMALAQRVRERRLEEHRKNYIEPIDNQKAQVRSEALEQSVEDMKKEKMRLEFQLEQGGEEEEGLLVLEEKIAALEEESEVLRRRARAYELATEWMEQALTMVVHSVKGDVEARVGNMISSITSGRYDQVRLLDDDFKLEAYSREKGGEVPVAELSRGTIDQVYLSARLALMESVCGGHRPPLILDDPFVTFDPVRIDRAMHLLKDFSRDYQVLLFTCSEQYDSYADSIVDLSGL